MDSLILFIIVLLATAAAQILGGVFVWFLMRRFCHNLRTIIIIEISLMFLVSVFLIEESLKVTPVAILFIVIGVLAVHVLNNIIPHKHSCGPERVSLLVLVAMCFHELPEGLAFGAAFLLNPYLGLLTAGVMALHNIPEGAVIAIPFFAKKNFGGGIQAVALTQVFYIAGGLAAYFLLMNIPAGFQALSLAFAAGAMLYIIMEEYLRMGKCDA